MDRETKRLGSEGAVKKEKGREVWENREWWWRGRKRSEVWEVQGEEWRRAKLCLNLLACAK